MTEQLNPTVLAALYRDVPTSTTGFTLCRQEERLMQYLRSHVPAIIAQAARIERYQAALGVLSAWSDMIVADFARAALTEGTSDDD